MTTQKNRSAAKKLMIITIAIIMILIFIGIVLFVLNGLFPEQMQEAKRLISGPKPANQTIIIQNQTINQNINQQTNFWDFAGQILWMVFALAIIIGGAVMVVVFSKKSLKKELSKAEVIEVHREIINSDDGHYRLGMSNSGDNFTGTLLMYNPYYDGTDLKSGNSFKRVVTFWSLDKIPPNTPMSQIPKHRLLFVDSPINSREKAINDGQGPVPGMNFQDWERWKYQQRHGLRGAPLSPIADEALMTPEEQKTWKEKLSQAVQEAMAKESVN